MGMRTGAAWVYVQVYQEYSYGHAKSTATGIEQIRLSEMSRSCDQRLCVELHSVRTIYVDPNCKGLACLLASRLIGLNKRPGVQPIGVGEVLEELLLKLSYTSRAWIS